MKIKIKSTDIHGQYYEKDFELKKKSDYGNKKEYHYEDEYGNFSEVAHSEKAISPSDKLSDNFDLLWGTVKEDKNTNQLIKYINSPIPTKENEEFIELMRNSVVNDEEFTVEVLERLLKVGASENLAEREIRRTRPDKLIMTGVRSS